MALSLALGLLLASSPATAGKCDYLLSKADTAKGADLVKGYSDLAKCDQKQAEENYTRFMSSATDADTLVALSKAGIRWETWNPVWIQLGKIKDYSSRDIIAKEIGASCNEEAKTVPFLQGAYFGLRNLDFQRWSDAFVTCENADLDTWLVKQVENPPEKQFDEKYGSLVDILVKKKKRDSLPHLTKAAVAAAEKGPFDDILMRFDNAVTPELGQNLNEADSAALEEAMVAVARQVWPERAKAVADRLANAGAEDAAATLLPSIYPDRNQGGFFHYGAVAVESADCKGKKSAVLHVATIQEPGKRWNVLSDAEKAMRALSPKLAKCDADPGPWGVALTGEPMKSEKEVDAVVADLTGQWEAKGYQVKVVNEKALTLK